MEAILEKLKELQKRLLEIKALLNIKDKIAREQELRLKMLATDFWNDQETAVKVGQEAEELASEISKWLKIETEIRQVIEDLRTTSVNLGRIRDIIIKEISGEEIDSLDFEFISDFVAALEIIEPVKDKSFNIKPPAFTKSLIPNLNNFKFIIVVNQRDDQKFFSVGPVWNYSETTRQF